MIIDLREKTVLVTGGSKNIGKEICLSLANAGANVWSCARSERDLNEVFKKLSKHNGKHGIIPLDLMSENGVKSCIKTLEGKNIIPDIVVHNLGGSLNITDKFANSKKFEEVWKFNLGIGIDFNNYFIPKMKKNGWGRIIHISTLATKTFEGNIAYVSAKCALEGYLKNLSRVVAKDNIVICAVSPGLVEIQDRYFARLKKDNPKKFDNYLKNHSAIGRMADPKEIANVVTFLASSNSDYMSGSVISIDGGGH